MGISTRTVCHKGAMGSLAASADIVTVTALDDICVVSPSPFQQAWYGFLGPDGAGKYFHSATSKIS